MANRQGWTRATTVRGWWRRTSKRPNAAGEYHWDVEDDEQTKHQGGYDFSYEGALRAAERACREGAK
jgi:hypothetical protein